MKKIRQAVSCMLSAILLTANIASVNAATVITENTTGTEDGYNYELWKDSGTTSMTLLGGGSFSCEWSNINNALFRKGIKYDCTKTYEEYGNISIDFDVDYNPNGNSYLCVYGWTRSPLVEYYIVESWGSWRPPGATSKGTVTIDGGVYDIYETTRVNQPSIDGNTTFEQYWSVRQTKRTSGTISVSEHFKAWENMGMEMGKLYEVALNVEGYQSSGSATVNTNKITVGGSSSSGSSTVTTTTNSGSSDGLFFHSTFENGADSWTTRGDDTVAVSSAAAYCDEKSLFVTGRSSSWNGTAKSLSTSTYIPGQAYSFSVYAMQNSISSEDFKLTLQYTDSSGETAYSTIAEGSAASGEWIQLANTAYTIPSGASDLLLYVETADSTTSFYIDEAQSGEKGTDFTTSSTAKALGDVNGDGKVSIADVIALQKYLLGKAQDITWQNGDMDSSNSITAYDFLLLKKLLLYPSDNTSSGSGNTSSVTSSEASAENWYNADISWIDSSKKMVAICFDDGPVGTASTDTSIRIQNALSSSGFHATFFYWGVSLNDNTKAEIKRAYDLGFEVANHTKTHPYLTNLSVEELKTEVYGQADALKAICGQEHYLIRPPYLATNSTVLSTITEPFITCNIDSQDWNGASSDQIISTITTAMNNGSLANSIVLCHETYTSTATAIEYLAPYLKQNGYQIVTVSELFKANGKELKSGTVYSSAK